MYKTILLVLFSFSLAFPQSKSPEILVTPSQYNFSYVLQGSSVLHYFTIFNKGNDTLKIKDVRPSCKCTTVYMPTAFISPGDSAKLEVAFDSRGYWGMQEKSVYILSNDPNNSVVEIKYAAYVVKKLPTSPDTSVMPSIQFSELTHDFGKIKEGAVVSWNFPFKNVGKSYLKITDIQTSCGCTAAVPNSRNVAPDDSGIIKVEFDSHYKQGQLTRLINVSSNDPKHPSVVLKIYADVEKGT